MRILKELRERKGVYQKDVADHIGVARTTYTKYETTDCEPSYELTVKLAKYFNVSTDYLLGCTPPGLSDDEQQLLDNYRRLTSQGKEYLLQQMSMAIAVYSNAKSAASPDLEAQQIIKEA